MPGFDNKSLNKCLMSLTRRSERADRSQLVSTFVDVGPLFTLITSNDHQILFGRRGTGKTHVLNFLSENRSQEGDVVVYIDLSNIGSSGGIYSDQQIPLPERATRLLVDTLLAVHDRLTDFFVEFSEEYDLSKTGPILDNFGSVITEVKVTGAVENEEEASNTDSSQDSSKTKISASLTNVGVSGEFGHHQNSATSQRKRVSRSGVEMHSVHFGSARVLWEKLVAVIAPKKIWVLLDEWSSVPLELQPYLADLVRRSIFPVSSVVTKIAAIEQRSTFAIRQDKGNYIGIEVGADAAADINLDDFMVFDNDSTKARSFYKSLLYKHVKATEAFNKSSLDINSEAAFIRDGFTQVNTFDELVRASEGVPRDAINIVIQAAQYADHDPISVQHIRKAAHAWYQRDKESAIKSNKDAITLLQWIIDEVIGQRRARAFLIRSDSQDALIEGLFDARIIHLLKRNVSSHDDPGVRYNVFKIDFGCYVDLMSTARAPQGLLPLGVNGENESSQSQFIEVPPDDYRAIRRAILDTDDFYRQMQ